MQLFVPLSLPFLLVGFIKEVNSAVTWLVTIIPGSTLINNSVVNIPRSAVSRALHSSSWPTLLNSDTATSTGVQPRVVSIVWLRWLLWTLISIAAIVTPLGLYDIVEPVSQSTNVSFHYVPDLSSLGFGTPPRSELGLYRICGWVSDPMACPGSPRVSPPAMVPNPYGNSSRWNNYEPKIPSSVVQLFQSGLSAIGRSVSSIFDIEMRTYTVTRMNGISNGSLLLRPQYRTLSTVLLDDNIHLTEGLIVDARDGGIGFRNHTVPPPSPQGSVWSEDILFIQPETVCVDTNLTLDFMLHDQHLDTDVNWNETTIPNDAVLNLSLIDHGGFSNLAKALPTNSTNNPQSDPDLVGRAYQMAWLNNHMTMLFLNVTDPQVSFVKSNIGQQYGLDGGLNLSFYPTFDAVTTSSFGYGTYLDPPSIFSKSGELIYTSPRLYENPWNITAKNFSTIGG